MVSTPEQNAPVEKTLLVDADGLGAQNLGKVDYVHYFEY
jgi:hypothetical protein